MAFLRPRKIRCGLEVGHLVRVTVHVIVTDVQYRRRQGIQFISGLELKARQPVHTGRRPAPEDQGRCADVAAGSDFPARGFRHLTHQGGDGGFSIRAGDRNDGRIGSLGEQINVFADSCTLARGGWRFGNADAG